MIEERKYNKILYCYEDVFIQLLFYNNVNKSALLFDGVEFIYKPTMDTIPSNFKELIGTSTYTDFEIENIKQDDCYTFLDHTYIILTNGDILQVHSMPYENEIIQVVTTFGKIKDGKRSTPSGISLYNSVLQSVSNAIDCEIKTDGNTR